MVREGQTGQGTWLTPYPPNPSKPGQTSQNVLLVVNDKSAVFRTIGEYYARKRSIPQTNVCRVRVEDDEDILREDYDRDVAAPVRACRIKRDLVETILYIVTTLGVPLHISSNDVSYRGYGPFDYRRSRDLYLANAISLPA